MRFVHLPTEVDAVQWLGRREEFPPAWLASGALTFVGLDLVVLTGKGPVDASHGDYIVRSGWEEFWPIAEAKFLLSYRPINKP